MTQAHAEVLTELSVASRRPVPRKWLPGFLALLGLSPDASDAE